jgi:hypothetical protein
MSSDKVLNINRNVIRSEFKVTLIKKLVTIHPPFNSRSYSLSFV